MNRKKKNKTKKKKIVKIQTEMDKKPNRIRKYKRIRL